MTALKCMTPHFYEPNPDVNAQYRPVDTVFGEDNDTMTRREWQSSNTIFDYSDQTIQTKANTEDLGDLRKGKPSYS